MARALAWPSLLAQLDAGMLERLLGPHASRLARLGALPGPDAPAWRERLGEALGSGDPALPAALRRALASVAELATPEGERELLALAAERGVALAAAPGRAADAAALAYLEHRALFRDAGARLSSLHLGLLAEFCAAPGRPARPLSAAGQAALREGAGGRGGAEGAGSRGGPGGDGAWAASVADFADELVVVFGAQAAPGAATPARPPVVAVFYKDERVLSVGTPDPEEQERLRALFGRVLFGDEAAFAPGPRLSGAPLAERGAASLRPAGVDGLAAVRLRKVVVQTPEASGLELSARTPGGDLADALGEGRPVGDVLRLGEVVHWALEFFLAGRAPFVVEFYPPNRWRLPDRRDAPLVRSFLALRGFLTAGA